MKFIRTFHEVGLQDVGLVGGKNASIGELCQHLTALEIHVPCGFAVTVAGFEAFIRQNQLDYHLNDLLAKIDRRTFTNLQHISDEAKQLVIAARFPEELVAEIWSAYEALLQKYGADSHVAVRSSSTAEDLAEASFAGQYESFLNIHGREELISSVKKCYASLFNARALKYRIDRGYSLDDARLSVGIQTMIRADLACSGVCFTIDPDTGFDQVVVISGAWGLGDNVVQGKVDPDEFHVFKPSLEARKRGIVRKRLGSKALTLGYASIGVGVENRMTSEAKRNAWVLSDQEVETLACWAMRIEKHYGKPMDLEWAKDGVTGELFIVQARPETVHARKREGVLRSYQVDAKATALCIGQAVGTRIATGKARVLHRLEDAHLFETGEVLIAETTNPDWDIVMKRAAAIVTNHGGRTSHAAIVARELGVAAIVGATGATDVIKTGEWVTVNCTEGKVGKVLEGKVPWTVKEHALSAIPQTHTAAMLVLANPDKAYEWSFYPNAGVGLMRMEFLISHDVRIHPMALARFDEVQRVEERKQIELLTKGYPDKAAYFIDRLSQGVATIAAAFYPKDVIVRFSDFKSNEYASLLGGSSFEEGEENPMIGFRGASRYYHKNYRDGFELECKAIDYVRTQLGLTNVKVMVPFCRTVEELKEVLRIMTKHGLQRGVYGLEIYMMVEVPSNVIQADAFAELVDGFSIGSNDLTQLTLGIDRDSALIAPLFNERNPAVEWMIAHAIEVAHRKGIKIGLCGQAPSDDPDFAAFLVRKGIDSISFTPDALIRGIQSISFAEQSEKQLKLLEI
ncbi:MAG: phosphoenolpyruvate synthase [Flavobacteriales bacterium]|jgi:pyruvate,water dikinase